jgi:adenylate kinase family enzyme
MAQVLDCPHIELDGLYHQPEWQAVEVEEFRRSVEEAVSAPTWVVDGNYSAVRHCVWEAADTVVFLDMPLPMVLSRLVPRTVRRVITQEELWNGNREPWSNLYTLDPQRSVIAWSVTHYAAMRQRYLQAAEDPQWSALEFIRLCSPFQVQQFMKNFTEAVGKGDA